MSEIVAALTYLAGDLLIGTLMLAGFGGVLIAWALPAIWSHPIAAGIVLLLIASLVKAHS